MGTAGFGTGIGLAGGDLRNACWLQPQVSGGGRQRQLGKPNSQCHSQRDKGGSGHDTVQQNERGHGSLLGKDADGHRRATAHLLHVDQHGYSSCCRSSGCRAQALGRRQHVVQVHLIALDGLVVDAEGGVDLVRPRAGGRPALDAGAGKSLAERLFDVLPPVGGVNG